MKRIRPLGVKGKALLRIIVAEIDSGRFDNSNTKTFISYSEALRKLGYPKPWLFPGRRLQPAGLTELNEWTIASHGLPHVCGLIVNMKNGEPSDRFPKSHQMHDSAGHWKKWWRNHAAKSIGFNWNPYV